MKNQFVIMTSRMPHILVIDDEPDIIKIIRTVLEEKGYQVVGLVSSAEIFQIIQQTAPDLILLDLWMPIVSGEEVITQLKSQPQTAQIPIMVLSASKDTETIARRMGADDYLCKPFEIEELELKVANLLP